MCMSGERCERGLTERPRPSEEWSCTQRGDADVTVGLSSGSVSCTALCGRQMAREGCALAHAALERRGCMRAMGEEEARIAHRIAPAGRWRPSRSAASRWCRGLSRRRPPAASACPTSRGSGTAARSAPPPAPRRLRPPPTTGRAPADPSSALLVRPTSGACLRRLVMVMVVRRRWWWCPRPRRRAGRWRAEQQQRRRPRTSAGSSARRGGCRAPVPRTGRRRASRLCVPHQTCE